MNGIIRTKNFEISRSGSTYFVADIAANHDGSLPRAKELIRLAAESGANAAKFQNFLAKTIVSRQGFYELGNKMAHQSKWTKDVYSVYEEAELPWSWSEELAATCAQYGIDYFTAPYDLAYIDQFSHLMEIIKVGSGDITWIDLLNKIAKSGKYVFLATGASSLDEVARAVNELQGVLTPIVIMQCNTNYTGSIENFENLNLNVLRTFSERFPEAILGLSDHTQGHLAVLGAVALGARVIEKHFTDNQLRKGPDHAFSLTPKQWHAMVLETRRLEAALGNGEKRVEENEVESRVVQRRALRFAKAILKGEILTEKDLIALRPCPPKGIEPHEIGKILGRRLRINVTLDELVTLDKFE